MPRGARLRAPLDPATAGMPNQPRSEERGRQRRLLGLAAGALLLAGGFLLARLLRGPANSDMAEPEVRRPAQHTGVEAELERPGDARRVQVAIPGATSEGSKPAEAPSPPLVGHISGRIVDGSGNPFHPSAFRVASEGTVAGPFPTLLGEFELDVAPGRYRFEVDETSLPKGILPPWRQDQGPSGGVAGTSGFYGREVDVPDEGGEFHVELRVFVEAVVFGRVIDHLGQPIEGVGVRLQSRADPTGLDATGTTDAAGRYELQAVYPGRYRTEVWIASAPDERHRTLACPLPLDVEIPEGATVEIPTLIAGGGTKSIRGRVQNQDGQPFAGLSVLCYLARPVQPGWMPQDMGSELKRVITDASGAFELTGLPDEPVKVSVTADWEPNAPLGRRKVAFFIDPVAVDLRDPRLEHVIPVLTVDESRPFTFRGRVLLDPSFAERHGVELDRLQATVALRDPNATWDPRVTRRPRFQTDPRIDGASGELVWMCETPLPPVVLTLTCRRCQGTTVTLDLDPRPLEVLERTIPFP